MILFWINSSEPELTNLSFDINKISDKLLELNSCRNFKF